MKFKKYKCVIILACILALCSCALNTEEAAVEYYQLDMFSDLVVNQSTVQDIYAIEPECIVYATSFGGVVEFPTEDNQYIRIKIAGPEKIISSIELVNTPWVRQ